MNLHDSVVSGKIPGNEKRAVLFQAVEGEEAKKLNIATGLNNLEGLTYSIDSFGIRHSYNEHGNPEIEAKRGQEAVTAADFAKIPDIINNYDDARHIGQDRTGNDLIQYQKQYNWTTCFM